MYFSGNLLDILCLFVDDCCSVLSFSALLALSAAFLLSHLCRFSHSVSEARLALDLSSPFLLALTLSFHNNINFFIVSIAIDTEHAH